MVAIPTSADIFAIPPETRFSGHAHEGLHLCAILSGAFRESIGKSSSVATSGMLRISPSSSHNIRFGPEGARCLLIEVGEEDTAALRRPPRASEFLDDPWLTQLALGLEQSLSVRPREDTSRDLVLEILAQVARRVDGRLVGPPPHWLAASRDRLADEWMRPPSAQDLALAAGVHRVHLVRSFRDHFGCTIGEYVRRRRVSRATHLLLSTDLPLTRVALDCGFADQAHLTRVLRRVIGDTPLALRRRARGGAQVTSIQDLGRIRLLA